MFVHYDKNLLLLLLWDGTPRIVQTCVFFQPNGSQNRAEPNYYFALLIWNNVTLTASVEHLIVAMYIELFYSQKA